MDTQTTFTIADASPTILAGDVITFAGVYRRWPWWKRALVWLGLKKPQAPPEPLRRFIVTRAG
jgi:hypothetical protein